MKGESTPKGIWAIVSLTILVLVVSAQCDDLDFPFRQFSTNDLAAVVYNTFDIDATFYTARPNPTYDIITCGYTD